MTRQREERDERVAAATALAEAVYQMGKRRGNLAGFTLEVVELWNRYAATRELKGENDAVSDT